MSGRFETFSALLRATAVACALLMAALVRAHPEIEGALERLNPLIAASPANAVLYLERGELYAQHEDWVQAEANYLRAAELSPQLPGLARLRGALALRTGNAQEACQHLNRALRLDPRDAEASILRSRARAATSDRAGALRDLETALQLIEFPRPELFLERAALVRAAPEAIRSLDAAIARVGPVHTLQLRALQLEESAGLFEAALARLAAMAAQSERKEIWLKRRGDLLLRAGRPVEARAAYSDARAAIEQLPVWLRTSPGAAKLAAELERLTAPTS